MTASAQLPTPPIIDLQCARAVPDDQHLPCQLYIGHEGPHAVLFIRSGERVLRTWTRPTAVRERRAGQENLPWVPGVALPVDGEDA